MTKTITVPAGDYCLVPATYESGVDREFLIRIWLSSKWKCKMEEGKVETIKDYKVFTKYHLVFLSFEIFI